MGQLALVKGAGASGDDPAFQLMMVRCIFGAGQARQPFSIHDLLLQNQQASDSVPISSSPDVDAQPGAARDGPNMAHPSALPSPASQSLSQAPRMLLDDYFALTPEQASQADRFREELRSCETDAARYELCVQKRDELLDRQIGLELLVATCELIMSAECPTYQRRKQTPCRKSRTKDNAKQRHRFLGPAKRGDRMKSSSLTALKEVARCWGPQIIQHYQWASRGERYCNQLRAAARKVPQWDDAVLGLNWWILQRSRNVRQRPVRASVNPIEQHDLERLKTWSQDPSRREELSINDIPDGLGFDTFGLLVHEEFATVLPCIDRAGSLGSSASPKDHYDASAKSPPLTSIDLQGATTSEESNHVASDPILSEVIGALESLRSQRRLLEEITP